jgi:hypothetical protein
MGKKNKPTAPAPPSQNIVNCLFSKRHVKIEKAPDDDEPTKPEEEPAATEEPSPIGEPAEETQVPQEPAQETQVPEFDVVPEERSKASLGP